MFLQGYFLNQLNIGQNGPLHCVIQIFKTALMSIPDTDTVVRHGQCLANVHYNVMIHKVRNYIRK